eukprot:scaffold541833_cov39-Prasinocladus_malaysianus.AAC.1
MAFGLALGKFPLLWPASLCTAPATRSLAALSFLARPCLASSSLAKLGGRNVVAVFCARGKGRVRCGPSVGGSDGPGDS